MYPRYLKLLKSGELLSRVKEGYESLRSCRLCPRECGVNRLKNETGFCRTGKVTKVASFNSHLGEEPPISGSKGSGTIFFSSCNMHCLFCQNYPISQLGHGSKTTPHGLARMMLSLQDKGCHNINLVTPSHVVPQFIAGLYIAAKGGLRLPVVYNSSGYDGLESLKLLDGIIDVYMPDIKYSNNDNASKLSRAKDYWKSSTWAVTEMHRQVGDLKVDSKGIAHSGLIIRHLVLPNNLSGTEKVLEFIAEKISNETYISLMSQYFPANKAVENPSLNRRVSKKEFAEAVKRFHDLGLKNGWLQEM